MKRRSHTDVRLGRFLTLGQHWRNRHDLTIWTVRQVHRMDCTVELVDEHDRRQVVRFEHLRADWRWIAPARAMAGSQQSEGGSR